MDQTHISSDIVMRMCVYKQYVWYVCANNVQAVTAEIHIKQVFWLQCGGRQTRVIRPERCKIQGFRAGAKKHSGKMKKIL